MAKWLALECESCTLVSHIQHKMFAIVLLTIYLNEAPSAIMILALFPENKKAVFGQNWNFQKIKSAIQIKLEFFPKLL
jgi:hypothetical protein